jgi:hypothetical protein
MRELLNRLAPVARTVAWAPLLGGALACLAITAAAGATAGTTSLGRWPGLGALALCTGAAFLLDEAAGATLDATPRSRARRRMLRIGLAFPLLCGVWAGSLWYATAVEGTPFGPDTRAALSVQLGAMLALTLAASAIALRLMPDERGGWTGAAVLFSLLGAALWLPERWTLLAAPGDDAWNAAQQRWAALLALALLALVWASRDPAARNARCHPRDAIGAHLLEDPQHAEIPRSQRLSEALARKRVSHGLRVPRERVRRSR